MMIFKIEMWVMLSICWILLVFIFFKEKRRRLSNKESYIKLSSGKKGLINIALLIIPTLILIIPAVLIRNV